MCQYDSVIVGGVSFCPHTRQFVVAPRYLRASPQGHALSSLDAILMNDSAGYPQTQLVNLPNLYNVNNQVPGQGQLEHMHRSGLGSQWAGSHDCMEGQQTVQHGIQGADDSVGSSNLARDASNASSIIYFDYGSSNGPSHTPSYQHSLDAFSGYASPTFSSLPHPPPLAPYAAQGRETAPPYGDMSTNEQLAGGHQDFGDPRHGSQQIDLSLVPRSDNNLPASTISQQPRSSGIPEGSEPQRRSCSGNHPQPGNNPDTQTDDVFTHSSPNGNVADTAYDLIGLVGPSQVADVPYSSEIEVDNEDPPASSLTVQNQPQPPRLSPEVSGGADPALARDRARGISNRPGAGKRAGKAAKNLVENVKNGVQKIFKPKNKKFKTTSKQYTKNRQIGMCLLCKLGGRKQACNYFKDDRVCDVCRDKYGEHHAAEFCFQHHQVEELELWRPAHETASSSRRLSWPMKKLGSLSLHLAIGPLASCCCLPPVALDLQNAAFDSDQFVRLIRGLGIGLVIDQTLSVEEDRFVDRARLCVGLQFLIERSPEMMYYAGPGERELGRYVSHAFLHHTVYELSSRTKSLAEDSHKWLMKDARNRPGAVLIVLAVLYGLYARQSTLEPRGYPGSIICSLREQAGKAAPCLLRFGNATYELMDGDYKSSISVADFDGYSCAVLQELAIHLEDEIHAAHGPNPPGQASPFSRDWISSSNASPTPLYRLLDCRGKSQSPDSLERSRPSIREFLNCIDDPPFLSSPNMQSAQRHIIHTGVPGPQTDDGSEEEATPRLREDKGKGRADNIDIDIGVDPRVEEEREEEEFQSSLRASRTTNASAWGSSSGHPSRPSGSSGNSSQRCYRYA